MLLPLRCVNAFSEKLKLDLHIDFWILLLVVAELLLSTHVVSRILTVKLNLAPGYHVGNLALYEGAAVATDPWRMGSDRWLTSEAWAWGPSTTALAERQSQAQIGPRGLRLLLA